MAQKSEFLLIAKGEDDVGILPRMANRHGLVAGATGTGKTITLRVMAEQFSRIGVPVFMADVKGDLSGMAKPGNDRPEFAKRARQLGIADYAFESCPTVFWDVFGLQGHPVRATISEMGPLLPARVLNLNDIQSGVLAPTSRGPTAEPESETAKLFGAMARSAAHAVGSQIGRQILRGVLGSIFGGRGKRR